MEQRRISVPCAALWKKKSIAFNDMKRIAVAVWAVA
jgi:hypothetical protein